MTGDVPLLVGEERFLKLGDESVAWSTVAGTFYDCPVNDFTVAFKPKRRNGQARTGNYQQRYAANVSGHCAGNLVTPLYGFANLAQTLMTWGFTDQENKFPLSKSAQWVYVNHEDDKSFVGLRVNSATLAGSESGIILTLELIGKSVTNGAVSGAAPPNSRNRLVEFLFEDCTVSLGGTAIPISAFSWTVQKNLSPIYHNSPSLISLPKTSFKETFSVTPLKEDATYDALRDALGMPELAGNLTVKGGDNAGHVVTCSVAFPRLSLIDSTESGGIAVVENPLTFDVLKPDSSSTGSAMTWTTV